MRMWQGQKWLFDAPQSQQQLCRCNNEETILLQPIFRCSGRASQFVCGLICLLVLAACQSPFASSALIVPDLLTNAARYNGSVVSVQGAFLSRTGGPATSVLALGVSTQDNGLDARPLGDPVWLEGFPLEQLRNQLHQPGDAVYGFVTVTGKFETGANFGPDQSYKHRITVTKAESIERITRTEQRVSLAAPGEDKIGLGALADNPGQYANQKIVAQGYYFWNGTVNLLAEGVSAEEDGSNPQPIGKIIWMEGFPPPVSGQLKVGPGSPPAYVWGKVEVKGQFLSGGKFGKDGAYPAQIQLDPNAPDAAKAIK